MDGGRRALGAAFVATLWISGCAKGPGEPGYVHHAWQDKVGFWAFDGKAKEIWRSPGLSLFVDAAAVQQQMADGLKLVMVSYQEDHPDRRLIDESPNTLAISANGSSRYALMGLTDQNHIDDIAARMHRHAPGVLPCGSLQRLYLTQDYEVAIAEPPALPTVLAFDEVADLLTLPETDNIATSIATLEALGTRHHASEKGAEATTVVEQLFSEAGSDIDGFTVTTFDHAEVITTQQKSVIATIPGKKNTEITVVVGAHLDSINNSDQTNAPGADDDASGIAVITEMIRVIAESGATFDYNIEFQGYAAEEVGLEGSKHIAKTYSDSGKVVSAMMQLDMTTYSTTADDPTIYLVSNNTNLNLRRSLKNLMHSYLDGNFRDGTLLGGSSDHEAWTSFGFPAVFPFENPVDYNKAIHTPQDTSDNINNMPLATRFTQLGLAFVSHYAGLTGASDDVSTKRSTFVSEIDTDLPIAITSAGEDGWNVAVSVANAAVKSMAICRAQTESARSCSDVMVDTTAGGALGDRSTWLSSAPLDISSGDRLVLFGYDETDKIVAQRTVKVEQR